MADSYLPRANKHAGGSVVRCPYCVEDGNFKAMSVPESGDGHVCNYCGHVVLPSNPMYQCTCVKCIKLKVS